jgi:ArsR family transcriptional regulator, arsenate/arsenite/antimonite-responsive transcriptional repressor
MTKEMEAESVAAKFEALGSPQRLKIVRHLLAAHPNGLYVHELQSELKIAPSTISHHLERLRYQGLIDYEREGTYLKYRANAEGLREVLTFLYAECCTRNKAVDSKFVVGCC